MKKIIFPLVFLSLFFVAQAPVSRAYVQVLGIKVPTTLSEIKNSLFRFKYTNFSPTNAKFGNLVPTVKVNNNSWSIPEISPVSINTSDKTVTITESQLNKTLTSVKGKSFSGYTVNSVTVDLMDGNKAKVSVSFSDGKAFNLELVLINEGTSFEVVSLTSTGQVPLSAIEEMLIKQAAKQAQTLILNYYPQYKSVFKSMSISSDRLTIYLSTPK